MDIFKICQLKNVGIGGIHCHCCNDLCHKNRKVDRKFNRMARARMKRLLLKELKEK